jgi:hypothetical protein
VIWLPFALAMFLLGAVCSGPVWTQLTLRESERRERLARRRLKDLSP